MAVRPTGRPGRPLARQAGQFVGPPGRTLCPAPARPRAPLAAYGAQARANDRGLARNKEGATLYARKRFFFAVRKRQYGGEFREARNRATRAVYS